ncbi:MAG: hypothetical protein ACTSU2_12205 [Promethearchaeota archaeon]
MSKNKNDDDIPQLSENSSKDNTYKSSPARDHKDPKEYSKEHWNFSKIKNITERLDIDFKASFLSVAWSRVIPAVLLIIMGIVDFKIFGYSVGPPTREWLGQYMGTGTAFILGGFSFFYPIGLPALGIGISLLIYGLLSPFYGHLIKTNNSIVLKEWKIYKPSLTEIPLSKLKAVRIRNNHLGPKVIWIYVFLPIILISSSLAIHLFNHPLASNNTLPTFIMLTVAAELTSVLLLTLFPQSQIEFLTDKYLYDKYIMRVYKDDPYKFVENLIEHIKDPKYSGELKQKSPSVSDEHDALEIFGNKIPKKQVSTLRIITGASLIIIGLIDTYRELFFGILVWSAAVVYGLILLIDAIFKDYKNIEQIKPQTSIETNRDTVVTSKSSLILSYKSLWKKFKLVIFDAEELSVKENLRKLDVPDIIGIPWILLNMGIEIVFGFRLQASDTVSLLTSINNIICVIIFIYFVVLFGIMLLVPIFGISIKLKGDRTYNLHIPISEHKISLIQMRKRCSFRCVLKSIFINRRSSVIATLSNAENNKATKEEIYLDNKIIQTFYIRLGIFLFFVALGITLGLIVG